MAEWQYDQPGIKYDTLGLYYDSFGAFLNAAKSYIIMYRRRRRSRI